MLLGFKKEHIWISPSKMDEPRDYCTEWSKLDKYCILTHVWNLERCYWLSYLQGNSRDTELENRFVDIAWERESRANWESSMETYAICSVMQGAQPSALWQPRGAGDGREIPDGGAISIPVADPCWCMAKPSTIL